MTIILRSYIKILFLENISVKFPRYSLVNRIIMVACNGSDYEETDGMSLLSVVPIFIYGYK